MELAGTKIRGIEPTIIGGTIVGSKLYPNMKL